MALRCSLQPRHYLLYSAAVNCISVQIVVSVLRCHPSRATPGRASSVSAELAVSARPASTGRLCLAAGEPTAVCPASPGCSRDRSDADKQIWKRSVWRTAELEFRTLKKSICSYLNVWRRPKFTQAGILEWTDGREQWNWVYYPKLRSRYLNSRLDSCSVASPPAAGPSPCPTCVGVVLCLLALNVGMSRRPGRETLSRTRQTAPRPPSPVIHNSDNTHRTSLSCLTSLTRRIFSRPRNVSIQPSGMLQPASIMAFNGQFGIFCKYNPVIQPGARVDKDRSCTNKLFYVYFTT